MRSLNRYFRNGWIFGIFLVLLGQDPFCEAQNATDAVWMKIAFPLTSPMEESLLRQWKELANKPSEAGRKTLVLEFVSATLPESTIADPPATRATVGPGTPFESALRLARWLTSPEGNRLRSIAFLPGSLEGHSLLVAFACEEIAAASEVTLGRAGIDEVTIDATIRQAYLDVNRRRQAFPEAAIEALLDDQASLYEVVLLDQSKQFMLEKEWKAAKQEARLLSENELSTAGQPTLFHAKRLREWRWIEYLARDRDELSQTLGLPKILREITGEIGPRKPLVLELHGNMTSRIVNQTMRAIEEAIQQKEVNWILLDIRSAGGRFDDSLRLAHFLADLDSTKTRTIAYVAEIARGDASLIALACDEFYAASDALVGGDGEASLSPTAVLERTPSLQELAKKTQRDLGEYQAFLSPELEVFIWSNAKGAKRWAASASIGQQEKQDWVQGERVPIGNGTTGERLLELGVINDLRSNRAEVGLRDGIDPLPEPQTSNAVERFVQSLAEQSWLPPLLISVGFMALVLEMSTPGVTLPGFVAALCFLLFFWIRFLNGTVEWLEVLLFLGGALFLGFELFVLPGFGIFGFGGIVMLIAGLVLASQTFFLPTNSYQLNSMAWNLVQIAGAFLLFLVGLYFFRNQLDELPMLRWLKLNPAGVEDTEALSKRESVVHWEHLEGKVGVIVTRCNPAGKAQIGDDLVNVLSNGTLVDEGQTVRVVEVQGNRVIVEPIL